MDLLTILVIVLVVVMLGVLAMLYKFWQAMQTPQVPDDSQGMLMLQNQLAELTRAMDGKLSEGTRTMAEFMTSQSSEARSLLSTINKQMQEQLLEVVKGVTETKESTKQVFTIAEQLNNLEKVLKN